MRVWKKEVKSGGVWLAEIGMKAVPSWEEKPVIVGGRRPCDVCQRVIGFWGIILPAGFECSMTGWNGQRTLSS